MCRELAKEFNNLILELFNMEYPIDILAGANNTTTIFNNNFKVVREYGNINFIDILDNNDKIIFTLEYKKESEVNNKLKRLLEKIK